MALESTDREWKVAVKVWRARDSGSALVVSVLDDGRRRVYDHPVAFSLDGISSSEDLLRALEVHGYSFEGLMRRNDEG